MLICPLLQPQSLDTICVCVCACVQRGREARAYLIVMLINSLLRTTPASATGKKGEAGSACCGQSYVLKPSEHLEQEGPPRKVSVVPFSFLNTMGYDLA